MIKNGEFCVYNGNEYELNEDNDGKRWTEINH